MSEIASAIGSAVEEQGMVTRGISRKVQRAALGTLQVSSNVMDVKRGASETGLASSQVISATQTLSGESYDVPEFHPHGQRTSNPRTEAG